jgi:nitrogen regulatory protein PII
VVLILVSEAMVEPILSAIKEAGRFSQPGTGIAMVLPVEQTAGMESQMARKRR